MSVVTAYPPGTPCWVDLMAPDQQAAIDFYRDLFGWQGERGPDEFGGYCVLTLKDKPVAGIGTAMAMNDQPPPPTAWTTYLASADADASAIGIAAGGGTLLTPVMDVGTVGRMLIAADPAGAVFGVWQPVDFIGSEIVNEPGAVVWNELNTADPAGAAAFYPAALGIGVAPMEGMDSYFSLTVGGRTVAGMQGLARHPAGTTSHWSTYFAVDDTDAMVDTAVRAGASLVAAAFDTPVGRMAPIRDPQGGIFWMIAPTEPGQA
ncbi:VOC family protein [Kitasatospora mediocidica]|uniref:VOC family protein n=1 Tax=Kitasatospora mediocidica TaxID=58352 RepID=UPI00055BD7E2|nr:VOC family protein [Kitasatospora mediocidica]